MIEKYGSGIKRIHTLCKDHGILPPKISITDNGFEVVLFKEKINEGLNEGLNEKQKKVLNAIKQQPGVKIKTLSEILNIPVKTLDNYIKIFVDKNLVERKGSKKTGGYYATYP